MTWKPWDKMRVYFQNLRQKVVLKSWKILRKQAKKARTEGGGRCYPQNVFQLFSKKKNKKIKFSWSQPINIFNLFPNKIKPSLNEKQESTKGGIRGRSLLMKGNVIYRAEREYQKPAPLLNGMNETAEPELFCTTYITIYT